MNASQRDKTTWQVVVGIKSKALNIGTSTYHIVGAQGITTVQEQLSLELSDSIEQKKNPTIFPFTTSTTKMSFK